MIVSDTCECENDVRRTVHRLYLTAPTRGVYRNILEYAIRRPERLKISVFWRTSSFEAVSEFVKFRTSGVLCIRSDDGYETVDELWTQLVLDLSVVSVSFWVVLHLGPCDWIGLGLINAPPTGILGS